MKKLLEMTIRNQRGGESYWRQLAETVAGMTDAQAEAMYRVLMAVQSDAKQAGKNDAMRKLGLPKGIV